MSILNGISVVIPTWNNLQYLKVCVDSIRKHSRLNNEIILHVNDGSDGTLEYANREGLKHTHSEQNIGLCKGINMCARVSSKSHIVYFNDDMVALPDWDIAIYDFIVRENIPELFWACSMLIEGFGANPDFIAGPRYNFGRTPQEYDEKRIIDNIESLKRVGVARQGVTWAPCLFSRSAWDEIGGFTEEYDDCGGFGSDPDLAKKMYNIGCRNFFSVTESLVYHFGSIVTRRYRSAKLSQESRSIFRKRHGISIEDFINNTLHRGEKWDGIR